MIIFQLYIRLRKDQDIGLMFKKNVSSRTDIQQVGGSETGITHSVKDSERYAFADWINRYRLHVDYFIFQLYIKLRKDTDVGLVFPKVISTHKGVQQVRGSENSITHSVKDTERYAFADWINRYCSLGITTVICKCIGSFTWSPLINIYGLY